MRKLVSCLFVMCLGLKLITLSTVSATEIQVLRGEEEETELILTGTEDVYSMYGELVGTTDFILLENAEEKNGNTYQAMKVAQDGGSAKLLLSALGEYPETGLKLLLKVKGMRIGTGTISFANIQCTDAEGEWLEDVSVQPITVKVLPNPLVITMSGTQGNHGWYISPVEVTVTDKDAANIWYDTGEGKTDYTGSFELQNGSWLLTVTSDDGYGYKMEETANVRVDMTEPSFRVSAGELFWQQNTIDITAEAWDGGSGIETAYWAFSESREYCENLSVMTGEVLSVETDGIRYLHLVAEDKAGNEAEKVYGPYRKDSQKPWVHFENLQQGALVEDGIVPEIMTGDELSGVKNVSYELDGEKWSPAEITGKGEHVLTVTAEDYAGNICTENISFHIYDSICVQAMAEDTCYTGSTGLSVSVSHQGKPLADAQAEFFLNGESLGVYQTDSEGMASVVTPIELPSGEATFTVTVAQDEEHFLLGAQDSCSFMVHPEDAWLLYTGDYSVRKGESLRVRLETGEFPDYRMGDITRAELKAALYKVEKDGSRTFVEESLLAPDSRGRVLQEFYPETGLYELRVSFTENSCYTGEELILYPAVYDIFAELDASGGTLLLELPHLGIYVELLLGFLPPSLEAEMEIRIPGTGIVLTENRITEYDVDASGMILYGTALNPEDGCTYSYQIRSGYSFGFLPDELETFIWKGTDTTTEPVYHFEWKAQTEE